MWVEMSYNKYRQRTINERLRLEEDNYYDFYINDFDFEEDYDYEEE